MNRSRYEPVPQRDETIILDSIHNPNYNFNTGIPNSVPSSIAPSIAPSHHAPSIRSIPNSPPPSFHTHSSPGTPRPTPSTTAASAHYAELWGVASTTDAPTEMCAASDALSVIKTLQARVERLEESLGQLILEKEAAAQDGEGREGHGNCCVTFTDASSRERLMMANGSNCCVRFKSTKVDTQKEFLKMKVIALLIIVVMVCLTVVGVKAVAQPKG